MTDDAYRFLMRQAFDGALALMVLVLTVLVAVEITERRFASGPC
jgi:hypothetical protein